MVPVFLASSPGVFTENACDVKGQEAMNSEVREVMREWSAGFTGDMCRGGGKLQLVIWCSTRDTT